MIENPKSALLLSGEILSRLVQWASVIAAGIVFLLIPVVILWSQDMLPGIGRADKSAIIEASPLSVVANLLMMALILAAFFRFFGNLRSLIVSASEGDPFTPENAGRLNEMAWLFLGVKILTVLVGGLRLRLANLVSNDGNGGDSLDFSLYDLDAVVIVIVLFILARIFRHGAAMREDLNGTV